MDCNLKKLAQLFQVVSVRLQKKKKNDFNGSGLFSFCELRVYHPLDVQTYCAWPVKLPSNH